MLFVLFAQARPQHVPDLIGECRLPKSVPVVLAHHKYKSAQVRPWGLRRRRRCLWSPTVRKFAQERLRGVNARRDKVKDTRLYLSAASN